MKEVSGVVVCQHSSASSSEKKAKPSPRCGCADGDVPGARADDGEGENDIRVDGPLGAHAARARPWAPVMARMASQLIEHAGKVAPRHGGVLEDALAQQQMLAALAFARLAHDAQTASVTAISLTRGSARMSLSVSARSASQALGAVIAADQYLGRQAGGGSSRRAKREVSE